LLKHDSTHLVAHQTDYHHLNHIDLDHKVEFKDMFVFIAQVDVLLAKTSKEKFKKSVAIVFVRIGSPEVPAGAPVFVEHSV